MNYDHELYRPRDEWWRRVKKHILDGDSVAGLLEVTLSRYVDATFVKCPKCRRAGRPEHFGFGAEQFSAAGNGERIFAKAARRICADVNRRASRSTVRCFRQFNVFSLPQHTNGINVSGRKYCPQYKTGNVCSICGGLV